MKKSIHSVILIIGLFLVGCQEQVDQTKEEQAIRDTLTAMWDAIEKEDIERYATYIHEDFTQFGETRARLDVGKQKEVEGLVAYEFKILNSVIEINSNQKTILLPKIAAYFNNDLKGWETKDETIDFPLKEITPTKVVFEGMTFQKISNNEMNVYVDIQQKDGSTKTVKFNYTK